MRFAFVQLLMNQHLEDRPSADARRWWVVVWILGMMVSLPFLAPFKAPPVPSFHAEFLAGALGFIATCATLVFLRNGPITVPSLTLVPGLLCVVLVVQLLARHLSAPQSALLAALYLLWFAGLMIVGAALRQRLGLTRVCHAIAWFLIAGGSVSALMGAAQLLRLHWFVGWVMPSEGAVWGNLGQPNHFADYLAMALASVLLLWVGGKLRTVPAGALFALLCAMLPMSGSRSVWLYAGGLVVVAAIWFYRDRSEPHRRLLIASICVFPAMLAGVALWTTLAVPNLMQASSLGRLSTEVAGERAQLWGLAWQMFRDAPVTGVGYGQYAWNYFVLNGQDARPLEGYAHHAHNLVLQVAAELGIGGMLILALGGWLWVRSLRRLATTAASWWAVCVACTLGIHSLLEYPLWYAYFLGIAGIVLGLTQGAGLEFVPSRFLRATSVAILALGAFLMLQLFRDYVFLENFLAFRHRYIDATSDVSARARQMLLDIRRESLLAPYVELGLARSIQISPDQLEAKLVVNGHAMRNFPVDDVVYRQAMLLAMKGDTQSAVGQWDLALASYPQLRAEALVVLQRRADDLGGGLRVLRAHAEAH